MLRFASYADLSRLRVNEALGRTLTELDLLDQLSKQPRSTARGSKSLDHYLDRIAKLGGYLGRASDPPPGNIVMWRGLARLTDIAIGFSIREEKCG